MKKILEKLHSIRGSIRYSNAGCGSEVDEITRMVEELDKEESWDQSLEKINLLKEDIKGLEGWVNDLQSGMFINCVYCGHRYGPDDEVPASMADVLKEHISQCPKHPLHELKTALSLIKDIATNGLIKDIATNGFGGAVGIENKSERIKIFQHIVDEITRVE